MDHPELPSDLAALEHQLAGRSRPEPTAGFHQRLLARIGQELNQRDGRLAPTSTWRFVATIAAAALLWINFSMSVANNMDWHFVGRIDRARLDATAERIRELFPELPAREAFRQALLAQGGARLVPRPNFRPSPDKILQYKERVQWGMP